MKYLASRPWLGLTTFVALSLILLLSAAPPAVAGQTYAIKGAKIVPVRGAVIEKGNIVMRDGVIVAVGANVQIPPDALVIDGTGLEVYPGLIDASSSFGVPRPRAPQPQQQVAAPAFGFGAQQVQAPGRPGVWEPDTTNDPSNYLTPPLRGFTPDLMVGEQLEDGDAAPWRGIGITTVLAAPQTGIARGQSAVINLNDGHPEEMVVLTPAALHIALTVVGAGGGAGGGGGYPGTQLGALAALRQAIADAQWYQARLAQWEQSRGRGVPRPPFSTTSVAFLPALNGKQPVVVSVSRSNDVLKALRFAKENNFRLILETATEAWKVAPQVKASGAAVIVSLNFRPAAGGGGGGGFGQQQEPDAEEQRRREQEAQNNAAELTKAGIKVAFSSTGVQNPGEFLANARRAADSMGKDQVLAALTINAAEILGVGESLGSIEQGKIANLIVTTASPLEANAQLKYVFVDGTPLKFRSPEPPRGPAGGGGQRPGAVPGRPPGDSAADSRSEVRS